MPSTQQLGAWARRYLPAWVISTVATLVGVLAAQAVTHNAIVIASIGVLLETGAYYATLLQREVRLDRLRTARYGLRGFSRTVLNLALEFGLAEAVDTLLTRPALLLAATRLSANVGLTVVLGNLAADLVFCVPAIVVYEARRRACPSSAASQ